MNTKQSINAPRDGICGKGVPELLRLAEDRAAKKFPEMKIAPTAAWYSGGIFRVGMYADNVFAFGYGGSMNACCEMLIGSIENNRNVEDKIIYQL
ncbi:MAG: hypothetical protein LBH60_04105 [Prevotellaceae bacterium]|jgi:hypothetical protein|nr:hypothetical protein [Prevotellaceae bacterium]